jgi:Peptidase M15
MTYARQALALFILWSAVARASDTLPRRYDTKTASFAITYHGETSAYRDTSVVVLPGGVVVFSAVGGPPGDYAMKAGNGVLIQKGLRQWQWSAPKVAGTYNLTVDGPGEKDAIKVHAFVMVPAAAVKNGMLNGYRIGAYPAKPLNGNPLYVPPPGFIEVTKDNQDTKVSPHFVLKQFLCKEDASKQFPKYLVLQERLPLKLEAILERINTRTVKTDTLHIMSAYRTPFYNRAIGDVQYSMHQWGSAADIYVDPKDIDRMEDLNRDGRIDVRDAKYLYDEIEALLTEKGAQKFQGGMGFYPATKAHPPFVHVDVRGTRARWQG